MPRTPLMLLLAAMTALPAAAQPFPQLPPVAECAVLPESFALPHRVAAATTNLPPRKTCKGRCRVDIAFVYAPEVIGQHGDEFKNWPQSTSELENLLRGVARSVTGIWLKSGLNAELRFVGMEADQRLNGLTAREALDVEGYGRIRAKYGADLVFANPSGPGYHGRGWLGFSGFEGRPPTDAVDGALKDGSLWSPLVLGHQIGHNLFLVHDPVTRAAQNDNGEPVFTGGQGYIGTFPPTIRVADDSAVAWYERNGYMCTDHAGPFSACTTEKDRKLGTLMTYATV